MNTDRTTVPTSSGILPGETPQQAAIGWAAWAERRGVNSLAEFLREYTAKPCGTCTTCVPQPERAPLQAKGAHPAPCARFCESNAYEIELRGLRAEIKRIKAASPQSVSYQYAEYFSEPDDPGWSQWRQCSEADYNQWSGRPHMRTRKLYDVSIESQTAIATAEGLLSALEMVHQYAEGFRRTNSPGEWFLNWDAQAAAAIRHAKISLGVAIGR